MRASTASPSVPCRDRWGQGSDHEVEAFQRGLLGREMAPGADGAPEPGVERLDRVRREDHAANLDLEREERHELGPRRLPQAHDPRVLGAPGGRELDELIPCGRLRRRRVDRAECFGDRFPVVAASEPERLAD